MADPFDAQNHDEPPLSPEAVIEQAAAMPPGGAITDLRIEREMQDSYLTYAMSTIMDRALPDVRDGLKPSQRRILVAMHDLNLTPGRKHSKCAGVVGETMKKYHPHGDSAIYPTLVNLAQDWKTRYLLIDKQGNFGSIDGDPPAAMRYTEARMSHAAIELLDDLKLETVDFQETFDDSMLEPTVLPGRFPNLLVNGSTGIAVGMACSIPPHNVTEILDAIVAVIDEPEISLMDLLRIVPGPDFPTGGVICGRRGAAEAYATGRGRVTLRGEVVVEPLQGTKDRQQLVITSIPYQLNGETLMQRIDDAVRDEKIKDIADARNESDMRNPVRIVCELKRGADPAVVEQQLYQFTPLQQTYSIINIALVHRQPRTLSLREMIQHYIDHRVEVIRRRTAYLLREAQKKAHVLEGLIYAVCDIDEVIALIRSSPTREEAINRLMARRFRIPPEHPHAPSIPERLRNRLDDAEGAGGVSLTRIQAEAIGAMRLIQLVGLEIERLVGDYRKVSDQIEDYESILSDDDRVMAIIKEDCARMRERFGDERRTRIEDVDTDISIADLIQEREMAVTISHAGYVKRVPLETYRQQGRGGRGIIASDAKDEDFLEHLFVASTHDDLLCFTNTGRVFRLKVYELPELSRTSKGRAIINLIDLREGETVRAFLTIKDFERSSDYLTFVSALGVVKRTALKDYRNVNKSGIIAVGLREGDRLLDVAVTKGEDDVLLATGRGMSIRFNENDVRLMGRGAAGVKGIDLGVGDEVVGLVPVRMVRDDDGDGVTEDPSLDLLTITEKGYGKRTPVDEYRVHPESGKPRSQSRGGKGRIDISIGDKNGAAVAALGIYDTDDVMFITARGMLVRIPGSSIRRTGRGAQGVRVVSLKPDDQVIAAARVPANEDDVPDASPKPETPAPSPPPPPEGGPADDRPEA